MVPAMPDAHASQVESIAAVVDDGTRRQAAAMDALAQICADPNAATDLRVTAAAMLLQAQQHAAKLAARAASIERSAVREAAAAERRAARLRARAAKRARRRRRRGGQR